MAAAKFPYTFMKKLSPGDVRRYMRVGLFQREALSLLKVQKDIRVVMESPIIMKGRGRMHSSHLKREATCSMRFSPNFNFITSGWKSFCRKHNLRVGDTLSITIQSTSLLHIHILKGSRKINISTHQRNRKLRLSNSLKHPKLQPQQASLSSHEFSIVSPKLSPTLKHCATKKHVSPVLEMKEEHNVGCSSTKIRKETNETQPILCYVELKSCHLQQPFTLNIPKEFAKRMPQTTSNITLETMSKAWYVWYSHNKFTSGWDEFVKDLGLEEGDICIFKLASSSETIIHVYIYKKNKGKLYTK